MDTRSKILTEARAIEVSEELRTRKVNLIAVIGYFDVLLASHIRALRQLVRPDARLIAIVLNPPNPLLPQAARAELAAALAMIDYVVAVHGDVVELLRSLQSADDVNFELDDARRTRELIEHVQKRHRA